MTDTNGEGCINMGFKPTDIISIYCIKDGYKPFVMGNIPFDFREIYLEPN